MDSPALREGIAAVDEAFERGDALSFAAALEELERIARERVAAWRKSRGTHTTAVKIHSEILGAGLWVALDPADTDPDPGRFDAPVYSRAEVERLVEAHRRGELHPNQLRTLHEVKKLWPKVRVQPDGENPVPEAPASEVRAITIRHARTGQAVVVLSTVLKSWLRDGWVVVEAKTAHEDDRGEAIGRPDGPQHGPKKEEEV
jgi:hypothetical protein